MPVMMTSSAAWGSPLRPRGFPVAGFPAACVTFLSLPRSGMPEILAFQREWKSPSCKSCARMNCLYESEYLWREFVPKTQNSDEESRLLGIDLEFLAQARNVNINCASECIRVVSPNLFQQDF